MDIKELEKFAELNRERLSKNNLAGYDNEKLILHAMVKAGEELGEVSDVVLKSIGSQRKKKQDVYEKEHVGAEIADVFFTLSILAKLLEVDLEESIKKKMEIINSRYSEDGKEK